MVKFIIQASTPIYDPQFVRLSTNDQPTVNFTGFIKKYASEYRELILNKILNE